MATRVIGKSVPRKEGREKVTGRAKYVDDLKFPGMIFGVTVRSPAARGRILGIHFEPGIPWEEFTVVTAKDIPGKNCIALLIDDQPCLAAEFVNHPEEPVVLLAHPGRYLLEEARRCVRIEVEPLPAIFSMDDSLARKHVIWGTDNIFKSYQVNKGHVEHALREADLIVEGTYETGAQEQLYIEPQGMIAQASADVFGPGGFFDTFLGGKAEPRLLVEGFGAPFRMVDPGVGFKKHPSNYFTHRGIDAALA